MATYTKTVDPNGGADYLSLSAWEAGEQTRYSSGDTAIADCRRTGPLKDTTALTITGWTSAVVPKIVVNPAYRHEGKFADQREDGNYIYTLAVATTSQAISLSVSNTVIEGLVIDCIGSGGTASSGILLSTGAGYTIKKCIIKCSATGGTAAVSGIRQVSTVSTPYNYFNNNIVFGFRRDSSSYPMGGINCTSGAQYAYNNTVYNCDVGINRSGGTVVAANNASLNCYLACYNGTFATGTQYNVASDTTAPGTNSQNSKTSYSSYFVDASAGDLHLKNVSSVLWGSAGTNLSGVFTTDIDEDTRSNWDIGADEYTAPILISGTGNVGLTGPATNLKHASKVSAGEGAISSFSSATNLYVGYKSITSPGSFSIGNTVTQILRALKISVQKGLFTLHGNPAAIGLVGQTKLDIFLGSIDLTGLASAFRRAYKLTAVKGVLSVVGKTTNVLRGRKVSASKGATLLTGKSLSLFKSIPAIVENGMLVLLGNSVSFSYVKDQISMWVARDKEYGFTALPHIVTFTARTDRDY